MADKKVYFFKARLFDQFGKAEYSYKIIPELFKELLDNTHITKTVGNIMITSYQEHCKYKAFRSLQTRKNNI